MERRRSKRVAVNINVTLSVMDDVPASVIQANPADKKIERVAYNTEGAGEFFDGQVVDISTNGARLLSDNQPPLLSRVSIALNFAEHRYVNATGLVMWRTTTASSNGQYEFGVLFEAMPADVRMSIEKFVNAQGA